ncbi:MAG: PAS domain S-box protein [Rubrivivax sp.]|nr:PAS domain S-box protein [Rubrivivax sp.]
MLLLLLLVTAAGLAALNAITSSRLDHSAHDGAQEMARELVRVAATTAAPALELHEPALAEATLRALVSLPDVRQLVVLDTEGAPALALQRLSDGRVVRAAGEALPQPSAIDARQRRWPIADEGESVQAWAGAGPGGSLGSVGLLLSTEREKSHVAIARRDAMAALLLMALATALAAHLFLSRALHPLNTLVGFAGELAARAGDRCTVPKASLELSELGTALNDASAMLRNQLDSLDTERTRTMTILNAVPDVILGLDADCRIAVANPGTTSIFGTPPEQMRGLPLSQFVPELTLEEAERRTLEGMYMRATKAYVTRFETTARRHDGTEFPAEVSLSRVETEEGARYAAQLRDLTEQRMSLAMLNLYGRALECTSNGVVISDMSMPGQPVFYANPAFYRITGYEPGSAIGRNCDFLQRDDNQQPELHVLRKAVADKTSAQVVLRNYRKDGSLFFNELAIAPVTEPDGSVKHYVGVLNDVTERERSRMAIAERSARLNAVFDLSPDGFVVFDAQGQLAYCNRAFQAMTGWGETAMGLSLAEFDQRFAALCDGNAEYEAVGPLVQAEGGSDAAHTLMLVAPERRVLARVVRSQAEGHDESILFFRDITRETEVDRMKSEFLTTAAHELRTPMVSVFGFTELLLKRPVPEARRKDMLETIHRQASLLINMVNVLLDLARIEARQGKDLKREAVRLDSLVLNAVGPLLANSPKHDIRVDVPHGDRDLWVDPEKTHRALTNVLSNAIKYSPAGGVIKISSKLSRSREEPALGITVADQGIGMTPEQLGRVFERFYRADPSGNIPGTGLGMSLVKEIVELQGGRVEIDSEPGMGTSVTMWWPLGRPALSQPEPAAAPAASS